MLTLVSWSVLYCQVIAKTSSYPVCLFISPSAVIMTPTRELALQIAKECKKFSKQLGLRVVCVYGGTGISEQVNTHANVSC